MNGGQPLGEFELIDRYFSGRPSGSRRDGPARSDVVLGVGDDAAVLRLPENTELVVAVDTLVAGRHFPVGSPPRSIGHRALAVNLSDMAAMGATPAWATLALTLPSADAAWLESFSAGLMELADAHRVALVGGDTTAGPLTISVQILGYVTPGSALRRSGANAGDLLAVTGTLGDAGAGLALAMSRVTTDDDAIAEELLGRFEYPSPRVEFGAVARGIASAAMDLSDGLVGDLPKLATASGLGAQVSVERLPLSPALRALVPEHQAREWALAGGDDYELLLAVPPRRCAELAAAAHRLNLRFTVIGELRLGNEIAWSFNDTVFTPPAHGYDHFR